MDRVGVALAADDAASYFKTLDRVNKATLALIGGAQSAVDALNDLDSAERKAGKGARGLGEDTEETSKKLSFLERAAIGAAEKVGHLVTQGLYDAGRAVLQFGVDGVKAAGDFQGGMQNFEAVVGDSLGASGQSVEQFRDLFISLGRDLPVSTQEVQQAAIEMAKGGIEPATIAAGGLERVLKFAAAANLGLAESAEIASKTIGGWTAVSATAEEKAIFLAAATDLMAKAAGAASVDVDELALGLFNAQSKAKSTGVSFAETVTTITALAPGFASSAEAGNSFKNFLTRLIPENDKAAQAMSDLGLLTEQGTSAFYDAQGSFIGMEKASGLLAKATKGLTQAEKSEYLQRIFGNDAMGTAVRLAELGGEGYQKLAGDIAKQNGVAEQAAKKQQGWNVAVDNLMGSLEALQITAATKVLPTLTRLVNTFAGGVNALTSYVDATMEGQTALAGIAGFIGDAALPAIIGLTAATTLYALTTLPSLVVSLAASTAAFIANNAAMLVSAGLLAAVALAVGGAVYAWNEYNEKVSSATDQLLATRPYWTDSTTAIEDYSTRTGETAEKLKPLADNIQLLRDRLHSQLEELGKHEAAYATFGAASGFTREQLDAELASINQLTVGLDIATKAYNNQVMAVEAEEQAILNAQAASITATSATGNLATATSGLGDQAALTQDDIQKLTEKIKDISVQGGAALQSYASTYSTFFSDVERRQSEHTTKIEELERKKGAATTAEQKAAIDEQIKQADQAYADQEASAAESYVRQQEEQRKHLGQMLIDYTVAQATLATTDEGRRDRLLAVAQAVEKEYGLQESSTASTFLAMTRSIDSFSKDSGQSIDTLIGKLRDQETQAKNTQHAEDQYYHDSAAAAASTFAAKGGDVNTYIDTLSKIPTDVETMMALPAIEDREDEIKAINRGLQQLPKEVRIRISVKDDVPPEYKPGSPTPFELGIRGITRAVYELAQTGVILPGLNQDVSAIAGGLSTLITESDLPDDAKNLGDAIMEGWREGMDDAFDDLIDQTRDMSEELKEEMEDAWDTHSPSGVTEDLGENIMLGLLTSLDAMLPNLLNVIQQITATMGSGMGQMTDEMREQLDAQLDAIYNTIAELPDLINDALADAYTSTADFLRTQRDNLQAIFDIGRDPGDTAQLAERGASLDTQIAEKWKQLTDIRAGRVIVSDEERLKLERELSQLAIQRADVSKQQAEAEAEQQQRLALQQRTQAQITQATNEASAMDDPAKAAAFLKLRSQQILRLADLEKQRMETTDPAQQALIDAQIALEKRAQAAEREAFELQKDQLGSTQDLIDALNTLNDNLTIEGDMPPEILALYNLLVQLIGAGMASGGTMEAMRPYLVGEKGPELVVPHQTSDIYSALDTRRALMAPTPGGGSPTIYGGSTTIHIDARDFGVGADAIRQAVEAGVNAAAGRSDVRIRMGVQ